MIGAPETLDDGLRLFSVRLPPALPPVTRSQTSAQPKTYHKGSEARAPDQRIDSRMTPRDIFAASARFFPRCASDDGGEGALSDAIEIRSGAGSRPISIMERYERVTVCVRLQTLYSFAISQYRKISSPRTSGVPAYQGKHPDL